MSRLVAAITRALETAALRFADALELAVFEDAQQLRLQLQRQLADLVQEQGRVVRVLEIARARRRRAGERALGVTEQRRLHERRRDRRAVEREERVRRALAHEVQRLGDELLAAARFALDQHRERRVRELADLLA